MRSNFISNLIGLVLGGLFLTGASVAASKPHVITFGKWLTVQWTAPTGSDEKFLSLKVRALIVDGRVREYISGAPHEVTERLFVVRRTFRVNDSLPEESTPKWQWQRGGWLQVDRVTGRISPITLPDFDVVYSTATWYREYVAYCGVSDDGKKISAIVAQLNRRKPVLKKALAEGISDDAAPDSACPPPVWQRQPVRVSFEPKTGDRLTFAVRGHIVDLVNDDEED